MDQISVNNDKLFFASLTGGLYLIVGIMQFIFSLFSISHIYATNDIISSIFDFFLTKADPIGGLILILIGSIFLYGVMELRQGIQEGIAFVYVGILIALIFTIIYGLVATANWMEVSIFHDPEMIEWTLKEDIKPGLYLGILPLTGYILWKKEFKKMQIGGDNNDS